MSVFDFNNKNLVWQIFILKNHAYKSLISSLQVDEITDVTKDAQLLA
jgi:hypothetical protein